MCSRTLFVWRKEIPAQNLHLHRESRLSLLASLLYSSLKLSRYEKTVTRAVHSSLVLDRKGPWEPIYHVSRKHLGWLVSNDSVYLQILRLVLWIISKSSMIIPILASSCLYKLLVKACYERFGFDTLPDGLPVQFSLALLFSLLK